MKFRERTENYHVHFWRHRDFVCHFVDSLVHHLKKLVLGGRGNLDLCVFYGFLRGWSVRGRIHTNLTRHIFLLHQHSHRKSSTTQRVMEIYDNRIFIQIFPQFSYYLIVEIIADKRPDLKTTTIFKPQKGWKDFAL